MILVYLKLHLVHLCKALSQRATTIVAQAFPTRLVNARHSDIKRSIPKINAIPATGTAGTTDNVAASVINPAPVTPAAPFRANHCYQ